MSTLVLFAALALLLGIGLAARTLDSPALTAERAARFQLVHVACLGAAALLTLFLLTRWLASEDLAWGAVAACLALAFIRPWMDLAAMLILLIQRQLPIGATLEIGPLRGRVQRVGLRSITLQASDTTQHVLPATLVLTSPLRRLSLPDGRVPCLLTLPVPEGPALEPLLEQAREIALRSPWRVGTEDPRLLLLPDPHTPHRLLLHLQVFAADLDGAERLADDICRGLAQQG